MLDAVVNPHRLVRGVLHLVLLPPLLSLQLLLLFVLQPQTNESVGSDTQRTWDHTAAQASFAQLGVPVSSDVCSPNRES